MFEAEQRAVITVCLKYGMIVRQNTKGYRKEQRKSEYNSPLSWLPVNMEESSYELMTKDIQYMCSRAPCQFISDGQVETSASKEEFWKRVD